METKRTRPIGVTILAVLALIVGIFGLAAGLSFMGIGGLGAGAGVAAGTAKGAEVTVLSGLMVIHGATIIGEAVLSLAFAIGAWWLKPWAWTLGIILYVISLMTAVTTLIGDTSTLASQTFNIVIDAIIIYYLNTPAVKRAFGQS